jgi:excisionase family DNA binding protein
VASRTPADGRYRCERDGWGVNLKTAARRLGVHYQTAYRWVRAGQLIAVKVGSGYDVSEAALVRFQAQRVAVERFPDLDGMPAPTEPVRDPNGAGSVLDRMLDVVTIDARAVAERAAHLIAEVVGDAVIAIAASDGGRHEVLQVAHRDPAREVTVATIARQVDPAELFALVAGQQDEPLFIPQVPQRDVRNNVRPEIQQQLLVAGCYSVLSVPVMVDGEAVGALVVSRDMPGRPLTHDDIRTVEELAARVSAAYTVAARSRAAWNLRQRIADAVQAADTETGAKVLLAEAGDRAAALLDLDLRHVASTDAYAELFATDHDELIGAPLAPMAVDDEALRDALARVLFGEIDYCQVPVDLVGVRDERRMLHAAMVRDEDATPRSIVVVAHAIPPRP